jgi:hypothetical protein
VTEPEEFDRDDYDDDPPRSLLSALWFRTLLVVLVLGVIAVLAAPSLMDVMAPRGGTPVASAPQEPTPPAASPAPAPAVPTAPPAAGTPPEPASAPLAPAAPGRGIVAQAVPTAPPATAPPTGSAPRPAAAPSRPASSSRATAAVERAEASGPFWVQVGAFKDPEAARRLAARLRDNNYKVEESVRGAPAEAAPRPAVPAPDRYEVFIPGIQPEDVRDKLPDRTSTPEAIAGGVVLRPARPLAEALALSRALAGEGRRVQVRRAGGGSPATPPSAAALHRVRVGGFPDRAAAEAVQRELEGRGYRPFIARGDQ